MTKDENLEALKTILKIVVFIVLCCVSIFSVVYLIGSFVESVRSVPAPPHVGVLAVGDRVKIIGAEKTGTVVELKSGDVVYVKLWSVWQPTFLNPVSERMIVQAFNEDDLEKIEKEDTNGK